MADLTKEQREKLKQFEDTKVESVAGGALDTGLEQALSGAFAGASIGAAGGPIGAVGGALIGLVGGGLIGGIKAYQEHGAMAESQRNQMKIQTRAASEQKRQAIRQRGKAASELEKAYKSTSPEVSGMASSPGVSSFDAYKMKNYGG